VARVLILSYLPLEPANGGGRVRIRQIATQLARDHSVAVLCPRPERPAPGSFPFRVHDLGVGGARQLADPRAYRRAVQVAREVRPDVIIAEYVWQGPHASLARLAQHAPVILDAFDVATVRFRRLGSPLWPVINLFERLVLRAADRVLAVSEVDRAQLVRLGAPARQTCVVPNGVDATVFRPDQHAGRCIRESLEAADGKRVLLFFGQLDYPPNADAVRVLAREVMPRLDETYELYVAGRGLRPKLRAECGNRRVHFLGPVDPLPAYINAADTVVAPIRQGSGTRIKLLESLACGTPTVATSLAAEGLDLAACGPALTLADGWDRFAEAVRAAARVGSVPPRLSFIATYDWRQIVRRIPIP